ncbi:molybdopterin-guanine [Sphingomonas oleivorans]|uniref:Molybdenum cofactor guanylyltransferase n=1 Tax=Sphingomonas oleivorans TaxID=1735121 RepID=A0A2T5FYK0_9SPHN|nr:molybdenum cofactor guanylyltransferase [Sphingomonas oleivorans]PTQ11618.1 molybdopterin-guanine [Sphingomonas oleivorans]
MSVLGAIFAGGEARRFGSDKASAEILGVKLLDRVAARLRAQSDAVIVVGREWPGLCCAPDIPRPGMGPLGALAGALAFAREAGFDRVLTSGCDLPDLPLDLIEQLAPGPAVAEGQPLLGLWPSDMGGLLKDYLESGGDLAMRSWIAQAGVRRVMLSASPSNINTPEELAAFLADDRMGD